MKGRILVALLLASVAASPALAQGTVDGKWVGVIAGPQGNQTVTMNLKLEGTALTGTISDFQGGEMAIEEGMIAGDTISFYQALNFNGNALDIFYIGQMKGEDLMLALEVPGMPQRLQFTAKRAK